MVLYFSSNEYVIPRTHLINLSIVQGDFPKELKLAKVLPIYKSEEEHFTQNIIMDVTQVRSPLNTECPKDLYWGLYFSFYL